MCWSRTAPLEGGICAALLDELGLDAVVLDQAVKIARAEYEARVLALYVDFHEDLARHRFQLG